MKIAVLRKQWEGQVVSGRFPLLQWLGGSEHSAVFLTEIANSEKAAIKLIPAGAKTADIRISRWEMLMGVRHPHLLRLFHAGRCEIDVTPLLYVVMEYAEEDLSQVIPLRPLSATETAAMLPPILDALSFIHEKGLVHGHVTPANIMAVRNQLKLSSDTLHAPGELGVANEAVTPPSDVWSLGDTLVTALTQQPPVFDTAGQLVLPDSIPTPLRAVARECLRRNPAERCTVEQVKSLLRPPAVYMEPIERPSPATDTVAPRATQQRPRRNLATPLIMALIVLAVLVGITFVTRRSPQPRPASVTEQPRPLQAGNARPAAAVAPRQSPPVASQQALKPTGPAVPGAVAQQVLPAVPQSARNTIHGTVRVAVRVSVDPDGNVQAASLESPGPSRYFANLALEAARVWKFKPPQIYGKNVASDWLLHFNFGRNDTRIVPTQLAP